MRYFPTFVDLEGRACLVVGGGAHALAKVRLLTKTPARLTLIAPKISPDLVSFVETGRVMHLARSFEAADLQGEDLVYGATGIDAVDRAVAEAARDAGLPVNVVDRPALSSFITPAIVDRDPLVVAISSAGTAPVMARDLRAKIEAMLPARLGRLLTFAEGFRGAVKATVAGGRERRRFWEDFFASPLARRLLSGKETGARQEMLGLVNRARDSVAGSVAIVGAGPGDPDLLTFKALRYLRQADLVVYDRLVAPEILDYARRDAERLYAGKAKGDHGLGQAGINQHLLAAAKAGLRVVRLKGGDPFIFGRGGEELEFLQRHGVAVEVVPGITAAAGCAAAAGIPLTERGLAQSVTFLTGHGETGDPDYDWAALARPGQTLCVYMGVTAAGTLARRLLESGADPATPLAVIENGTRDNQKILRGRLDGLGTLLASAGTFGPAIIMIGEVTREAGDIGLGAEARAV